MKRFLSFFLLLSAICVSAAAQQRQIYLFPDFPSGSIYVNGVHRPQQVKMNIDALGQRIYYFQGDVLMELTQLYRLDSIKVSGHTFVRKQGLLCERLALQKDTVFVNWKFKRVHMGSAGALGVATHSNVQTLWNNPDVEVTSGEGHYSGTGALSPEIWQSRSENSYFFSVGGKEYQVRGLKDLYKAFPDESVALKAFVKEHRYKMENAQQALQIITYLLELVRR